jgi:nucleotide-binding universal stress UspA family protein
VVRDRLEALSVMLRGRVAVPVECVVLHGAPAPALERFAAVGGFELVVAGAHRRGADAVAGRVGRHLSDHAGIPVLVGPSTNEVTMPAIRSAPDPPVR